MRRTIRIDKVFAACALGRVVGRQEQRQRRHVVRFHAHLQALALQDDGFRFRRMPQALLARRAHGAGNDAIDADAIAPKSRARPCVKPSMPALAVM
jgi:hypothetical protein